MERKKTPLSALYDPEPPPTVDGPSGRHYHSTSLLCLRPHMEPRRSAIQIVESPPFEPLVMLTIICNCLTMAWESPIDPCCTGKANFIDVCEWIYLFIFTFEMFSKIIA